MKLEDCKVGQKVMVKRESTAKIDDVFDSFVCNLSKVLQYFGNSMVDMCKKEGGFYICKIRKDGNICLGTKKEDKFEEGWGIFAPEDFDLIEDTIVKSDTKDEKIDSILEKLGEISSKINIIIDILHKKK